MINDDSNLSQRAKQLHKTVPLIDGHNDLPWKLRTNNIQLSSNNMLKEIQSAFHTDIPRLLEGGLGGQFWSVYVPTQLENNQNFDIFIRTAYCVPRSAFLRSSTAIPLEWGPLGPPRMPLGIYFVVVWPGGVPNGSQSRCDRSRARISS